MAAENATDAPAAAGAETIDQFFLLVMGIVVYLMQCGFAFLEAGSVRSKNATNILIKNLMDSFIGAVSYYLFGYALAFGENGNSFCGATYWALSGLPRSQLAHWFFQFVFAATAATIVSGAIAERCEFVTYLVYSVLITGFVYPISSHWAWHSVGWLKFGFKAAGGTVSYLDFAGSGVVHVVGGTAALVASLLVGPRIGVQQPGSRRVKPLPGHSVPLVALGGFVLLFGFFAFNGGSQGSISGVGDGEVVALAMVNTMLCASTAAFATLALVKIVGGRWSLLEPLNGALTGAVSICAACDAVAPYAACAIGVVSGLMFWSLSRLCLRAGLDDPINAVAVHLGGGAWGVLAVALLHPEVGVLLHWNAASALQLLWQLAGFFAIVAWSAVTSVIIFGCLKALGVLRVEEETELKGLDWVKHGEIAYPMRGYGHGWDEEAPEMRFDHGKFAELNGAAASKQRSGQMPQSMGSEGRLNFGADAETMEMQAVRHHNVD